MKVFVVVDLLYTLDFLFAIMVLYVFTECSVDILDQRVAALSSTIEKLRSVSTKDHDSSKSNNEASYGDWKVCFFFGSIG